LGIALAAVVGSLLAIPGGEDKVPSLLVCTAVWLGGPLIWAGLTAAAYRQYGKKWRWFLIGAPFALLQLSSLVFISLARYYESISN
jgi:hypothetical protein